MAQCIEDHPDFDAGLGLTLHDAVLNRGDNVIEAEALSRMLGGCVAQFCVDDALCRQSTTAS